jgi:hypothetical protein
VLLGCAQERDTLEVEETLERLAGSIGVSSLGTVWLRRRELELAGWLAPVSVGRKGVEGSVHRLQVPPRLRRRAPSSGAQGSLFPVLAGPEQNRDIKRVSSARARFPIPREERTPRPAQTPRNPTPKEAAGPVGPPQRPVAPSDNPKNQDRARQSKPRRTCSSCARQTARKPGPIWTEEIYQAMLQARVLATGQGWETLAERERGQVRAEVRMLLAGGFEAADVLGVLARFGTRAPMRLVGLLRAVRPPAGPQRRDVRERAGARLPVTWPPDPARQEALEALAGDQPSYRSVLAAASPESRAPDRDRERFGELLARWSGRGR